LLADLATGGIINMTEKQKDIAFSFVILAMIGTFLFGIIMWPSFQSSKAKIAGNLYYVTVSFVMYIMSFSALILAKGYWSRVAASLLVALFSVNLYIELFLDPKHWTNWDFWAICVLAANLFVSYIILDKIKDNGK